MSEFQRGRLPPLRRAGEGDNGDAHAIAQRLGCDRLAGFAIEHGDQIRHGGGELAINPHRQMLVLEFEQQFLSLKVAAASHLGVAAIPAALDSPVDINDLAAEDEKAANSLAHGVDRIRFFAPGIAHRNPDFFGERDGAVYRRFLKLPHRRRIQRDHAFGAHVHDAGAGEGLDPGVADRVHQQHIAALVGHGEGAGGDAVRGEDRHLNLGEGAPHAIAIDHGDAQAGSDIDRHDRV